METLPVEVMFMIGRHLPVKDLTSCISVSRTWREIFGSDEVWRPWCDVDTEEYLRTTPCQVEPKFTSPQSDNSTLSPIGRWRTAYMQEAHMWRNWISGNWVEDEIKLKSSNRDVLLLNNDFVVTVYDDLIELTDTTLIPSVSVAQLEIPVSSRIRKTTKARSDTLVILNNEDIQVICVDFQSRTLSVKHTFRVNEDRYIRDFKIVNSKWVVLDSLFIHIWDLESGKKLKTDSNSSKSYKWPSLAHSEHDEPVAVIVWGENNDRHWFIYSVNELRILPFTVGSSEAVPTFAIVKQYFALDCGTSIKIYNYQTSQLLHEVTGSNLSTKTLRGSFVFINENQDLVLFSPLTDTFRRLISEVRMVYCYSDKVVDVLVYEDNGLDKCGLWKIGIGPACKISLDPPGFIDINQVHSKLINENIENYIKCLHFW